MIYGQIKLLSALSKLSALSILLRFVLDLCSIWEFFGYFLDGGEDYNSLVVLKGLKIRWGEDLFL